MQKEQKEVPADYSRESSTTSWEEEPEEEIT